MASLSCRTLSLLLAPVCSSLSQLPFPCAPNNQEPECRLVGHCLTCLTKWHKAENTEYVQLCTSVLFYIDRHCQPVSCTVQNVSVALFVLSCQWRGLDPAMSLPLCIVRGGVQVERVETGRLLRLRMCNNKVM